MDASFLAAAPADDLSDTIGQLHAAGCAVHGTMLEAVAAFDQGRRWEVDGASSMTAWLVARLGLSWGTAAAWVETAARLQELPLLAAAYQEGRLSRDQVRAAAEVANPDDEAEILARALGSSAAQLERSARRRKQERVGRGGGAIHYLRWWWERRGVQWHLNGYLPAEQGAVVARALQAIADGAPPLPENGMYDPAAVRYTDALVELAEARLAATDPAPPTLVVHVPAEVLATGEGCGEAEDGPVLSGPVLRRLACDARLETIAERPDGSTVGIGRAARGIPAWLARRVRHRDQGCRFPGCERTRWVYLHHVIHWADGGPTDLDNLLTLCGHHHCLVHDGGWQVAGHPDRHLTFLRPDGSAFRPGPEALRPEVRARLVGPVLTSGTDPPR